MSSPTASERARINNAEIDLATLRFLAQAASCGGPVNFVIFDCEKNELDPEILEISYVKIAIPAQTASVTQCLIQHNRKIRNRIYCPSNPEGLA